MSLHREVLCWTSVCFRLCLPVSEIKSDQYFILRHFKGRYYIRQVNDFVCVCVCLKSNQINVLCCVFLQGGTISDKGLFSSVPECVLN